MQFLFMFRSLTYAQRSARALERAGLHASVIRAPKSVSTRGCGYCAVLGERYGRRALNLLEEAGLGPEKIYRRDPEGNLEEVRL